MKERMMLLNMSEDKQQSQNFNSRFLTSCALSSKPSYRNPRIIGRVEVHFQSHYGICECRPPRGGWAFSGSVFDHDFWSLSCDFVTYKPGVWDVGWIQNKVTFKEFGYFFFS